MGDEMKVWTTVGSAGTLNAADLAKVSLKNAVIALGHEIAPPAASEPEDPRAVIPLATATVRYNVTPVDGLFAVTSNFRYTLQLTYRGKVRARLVQVDHWTGVETDLLHFDSASFPPAPSLVMNSTATTNDSSVMDFVNSAYYVEATLTASAIAVGNPAEIAVVKIYASPDFHG